MQSLESYLDRHAELLQMVEDLQSMLKPELLTIRPNAKTAHELLCDLSDKVKYHLAQEDKGLYPSLLIHGDPKVKSIAWGFISGEKPLRKTFDDYDKKWLKNCDFDFSDDFMAETREMLDMLLYRIEREEQVLLPKIQEIGIFERGRA